MTKFFPVFPSLDWELSCELPGVLLADWEDVEIKFKGPRQVSMRHTMDITMVCVRRLQHMFTFFMIEIFPLAISLRTLRISQRSYLVSICLRSKFSRFIKF